MIVPSFTETLKVYCLAEWFTFLALLATCSPLAVITPVAGRRALVRQAAAAWAELQEML